MRVRHLVLAPALALLVGGCGGGGTPKTPKAAFVSKCGSCHTLKAAGTGGRVGPDLDHLKPSATTVLDAIKHGRGGIMPPNLVSGDQAQQLAAYVARVAGR